MFIGIAGFLGLLECSVDNGWDIDGIVVGDRFWVCFE